MIMQTVNIHEAKTHLSRLVDKASSGESFIIAKSGKPMVKVIPLDAPNGTQQQRIGFLKGQINVPDNFDQIAADEIQKLFNDQL